MQEAICPLYGVNITITLKILKIIVINLWHLHSHLFISYICEACGDCGLRGRYFRKCPFLGRTTCTTSGRTTCTTSGRTTCITLESMQKGASTSLGRATCTTGSLQFRINGKGASILVNLTYPGILRK